MNDVTNTATGLRERILIGAVALWAALIIGLTVLQMSQFYSPVPVWDMWEGYLGFYEKVASGDWAMWFAQHNEHRIILGRLLFWADIRWFHGASAFLIVVNFVAFFLTAAMFWQILSKRLPGAESKVTRILLGLFVYAWLFLLCQGENLLWAFQGVFQIAFLCPLCALYWLQKPSAQGLSRDFFIACVFGVLAPGAMANGILVLPLMAAFAILTRQRALRIGILILLSATVAGLYFHGYSSPGAHNLLAPEVRNHIGRAISFTLTLLGSPFYYVIDPNHGAHIARFFGFLFVTATGYKAFRVLSAPRKDKLQTALLFFISYVFASTVAATGGRLFFGLHAALVPHYTTPSIMGWAALIALYAADLKELGTTGRRSVALGFSILGVLMMTSQIKAVVRYDDLHFDRNVTMMGLALGVEDQEKLRTLTSPDVFFTIPPVAEKAYKSHLSMFRAYPYRDAREHLGIRASTQPSLVTCQGALNNVEITTDSRFARVSGWLADPACGRKLTVVRFLDRTRVEIGRGLVGQTRPDVVATLGKGAAFAGFGGYVSRTVSKDRDIVIQAENRGKVICEMKAVMPEPLFSVEPFLSDPNQVTVSSLSVLPGNTWTGTDFWHTNFCPLGFRIYGSYLQSATDSGSISVTLKRGDRLLYVSGPVVAHQLLEIQGHSVTPLPIAIPWVVLNFSNSTLPDQFVAKFSDVGVGWGEWAAIAVRNTEPCH